MCVWFCGGSPEKVFLTSNGFVTIFFFLSVLFYLALCSSHVGKFAGSLIVSPYEPRHDKTNKMRIRPAKSQISLGIRVFAVRMKKAWVLSHPLSAQRRL